MVETGIRAGIEGELVRVISSGFCVCIVGEWKGIGLLDMAYCPQRCEALQSVVLEVAAFGKLS